MEVSGCCKTAEILEDGYYFCTKCGGLLRQDLRTCHTSYNQSTYFVSKGYSRRSRFVKKVLGSLRLMASHAVDEGLFEFLLKQKIDTPMDLLSCISKYPSKNRRPYSFAMYYWSALGKKVPRCTEQDIKMLVFQFDNIMFAWNRLGMKRPCFPYAFLFTKLVEHGDLYSAGLKQFPMFLRKLRCEKRRARYEKLFKKCINFDFTKIYEIYDKSKMEQKIDENEVEVEDKSEIVCREIIHNKKTMSPYDAKGIYKTQAEIDTAIANGTFRIEKTIHVDKNGTIFFLVYDKQTTKLAAEKQGEVSMRDLRIQELQQNKLRQASKLNNMLKRHAALQRP